MMCVCGMVKFVIKQLVGSLFGLVLPSKDFIFFFFFKRYDDICYEFIQIKVWPRFSPLLEEF